MDKKVAAAGAEAVTVGDVHAGRVAVVVVDAPPVGHWEERFAELAAATVGVVVHLELAGDWRGGCEDCREGEK